ncbi:ribonuclease HII [Dokdonella sp.]|uniref:ribonuclease HII n=1 Tax=Dokdonella sp. TaxID=2291710 RepID=UPI003C6FA27D
MRRCPRSDATRRDLFASPHPDLAGRTAGVDEAGRGPLAGPVVVAAVILDPAQPIAGLADSKALSARQRERLADEIRNSALAWSLCIVEAAEIDLLNILAATMAGMSRALASLPCLPELALIDGNRLPGDLPCTGRAIVGGDATEACISAASILAKTERDRLMVALDRIHPGYDFARHKGYPTAAHREALERLGPCPQHRRSFAPVRNALACKSDEDARPPSTEQD